MHGRIGELCRAIGREKANLSHVEASPRPLRISSIRRRGEKFLSSCFAGAPRGPICLTRDQFQACARADHPTTFSSTPDVRTRLRVRWILAGLAWSRTFPIFWIRCRVIKRTREKQRALLCVLQTGEPGRGHTSALLKDRSAENFPRQEWELHFCYPEPSEQMLGSGVRSRTLVLVPVGTPQAFFFFSSFQQLAELPHIPRSRHIIHSNNGGRIAIDALFLCLDFISMPLTRTPPKCVIGKVRYRDVIESGARRYRMHPSGDALKRKGSPSASAPRRRGRWGLLPNYQSI